MVVVASLCTCESREIIPKIKDTITKRRMVFTPRPARLSLKFMILPSNLGEDAIFWTAARVLKAEGGNAPCLCGGPRWSGFPAAADDCIPLSAEV
jgi:hypothetical protein